MPESPKTCAQLGAIALQAARPSDAQRAYARAIELAPASAIAWHGYGNALRALDQHAAAIDAYRRSTELAPDRASAWFGLGICLRLLGRIEEALASMRRAQALGHASPDFADAMNGLLHDAGRPAEALAGARQLVRAHPGFVPGHETLVQLLWENGEVLAPGEDPFEAARQCARQQPGNRVLQLSLLGMLLSARREDEVLAWLQALRRDAPEDPMLCWFEATALDSKGHGEAASVRFAQAAIALEGNPDFLNAHARHAFRVGKPELAARCAEQAIRLDPFNQEAWAHRGIAWRIAGDAREEWLFGYDRLVGFVEVDVPSTYPGQSAFLQALSATLDRLHLASRQPLNQSVRNGSQTGGRLFGREDRLLRELEAALHHAVMAWQATLPDDPSHPFLSRKRANARFVGSWSVRLRASGRHANHIHNEGWLSSAFYVGLPPSVSQTAAGSTAGWIQFGQPMEELGLDLPPRKLLRPAPGKLALFPSYMWHGTVPFEDAEPRLTVAFDMQPGG